MCGIKFADAFRKIQRCSAILKEKNVIISGTFYFSFELKVIFCTKLYITQKGEIDWAHCDVNHTDFVSASLY